MFTVCSKCNLRLTVTATDLRAAQGYVRCGRCHNVFNALAALADDPARQPEPPGTTDTQSRPALKPPEPPSPEPPAPEPEPEAEAEADHAATDSSLEFNPASTNINEVFIEAGGEDRTGTFESIILVGEEPTPAAAAAPPEDPVAAPAEEVIAPEKAAPSPPVSDELSPTAAALTPGADPATAEPVQTAAPATQAAAAPESAAQTEVVDSPEAAAPPADNPEPEPLTVAAPAVAESPAEVAEAEESCAASAPEPITDARGEADMAPLAAALLIPQSVGLRVPRWAPHAAATALALCLIAQVMHHYRGELADSAMLRAPVTGFYDALGQPLNPRWDIADYEIRQLGATADGAAAGNLLVRASISNRAPREQPLPLLRVIMQDRFGNRMAARDLQPAEYLGLGAPRARVMVPGQRVDVQVAFQDPGQAVTGFEIDACMASRDHTVTCANDPGAH